MNEIFNANDIEFSKMFFNDFIGINWNSLSVNLSKTTFVYKFFNGFSGRIAISNKILNLANMLIEALLILMKVAL